MILLLYSSNLKEWSFLPQMLQKCIEEFEEEVILKRIEDDGQIHRSIDIQYSQIETVIFINSDEIYISKWLCPIFSILPMNIVENSNIDYRISFKDGYFIFKNIKGLPLSATHTCFDIKSVIVNIIDIKNNKRERFNV